MADKTVQFSFRSHERGFDEEARVSIFRGAAAVFRCGGLLLGLTKMVWEGAAASTLERSGLTEHRLAKRLSISHARLAHVSFQLWQSTFSEERDRRAGTDANQQKRGRVSRELRAELEKALADGND